MKYDVIIIGGGPSGLMAGIAAAENKAKTLIIDKGNKLGRKLLLSGGGRCNVTNRLPLEDLIKHIPGNGRFLHGALSQFDNEDIISFFQKLGVELKEEDHGRMFPVSDKAQSVVDALIDRFRSLKGDILIDSPVKKVLFENGKAVGIVTHTDVTYAANAVVIAVGGKSVPQTGSTGDGYKWAKKAGHTITELFPTEVPVTSDEAFILNKTLQGLSLQDVAVSVLNPKGKNIITHRMDMIFTHFGLSGPAILRCSQFVVKALKKFDTNSITMTIDTKPDINVDQVFQEIIQKVKADEKKSVKNGMKGYLPERYLLYLLEKSGIELDAIINTVSHDKWRLFAELVKKYPVQVNGTLSLEKAFITGGGVSVKEIVPQTMGSKFVPNLYFCGEILDIHGYTGGYNITSAMVTGRIAGINAAGFSKGNILY